MLLTPHLLIGAAIGLKIPTLWLIIPISIFLHFLIDLIPHSHYSVDNIRQADIINSLKEFMMVALDIAFGTIICGILIWRSEFFIYAVAGMAVSVLPDALTFIYWQTKTPVLKRLYDFHPESLHPKKDPPFVKGLISQIIVSLAAIALILII